MFIITHTFLKKRNSSSNEGCRCYFKFHILWVLRSSQPDFPLICWKLIPNRSNSISLFLVTAHSFPHGGHHVVVKRFRVCMYSCNFSLWQSILLCIILFPVQHLLHAWYYFTSQSQKIVWVFQALPKMVFFSSRKFSHFEIHTHNLLKLESLLPTNYQTLKIKLYLSSRKIHSMHRFWWVQCVIISSSKQSVVDKPKPFGVHT